MDDVTEQGAPSDAVDPKEVDLVRKCEEQFLKAEKFDAPARERYALARRYAAGDAEPELAVQTNLIGNIIDVLVSFLYAQDPEISVRPAPRVEPDPQAKADAIRQAVLGTAMREAAMLGAQPDLLMLEMQVQSRMLEIRTQARSERSERATFAKTIELVVSRLWKQGRLKVKAKKTVRGALTNGPGWLKVIMATDKRTDPLVEQKRADLQDNMMRIQALQVELAEGGHSTEDADAKIAELQAQIAAASARIEVVVRRFLAIDYVPPENIQVSTDVADLEDYIDANWIANRLFVPTDELRTKLPDFTDDDLKRATKYYATPDTDGTVGVSESRPSEKEGQRFSMDAPAGGQNSTEHVCIIEKWDRTKQHVYTWVAGVHRWARAPYTPPQATSRFYPYFMLAFYVVDSRRHPQNLPVRTMRLQDEYNSTRSTKRKARERAVPGMVFNAHEISPEDAQKLTGHVENEWVGITPTNPATPIRDLYGEKAYARVDPSLFDTTETQRDLEKISGVQESLQQSVVQPKTATEAEIQQSGFAARSGADRDMLEEVLADLAQYTTELALQTLTLVEVQRIAGPEAFWPEQMDFEDITTMVEVDIKAGTTGKPNTSAERESWSAALPLVMEMQLKIMEARMMGNEPLAQVLTETLRETLLRLGDAVDPERFIPEQGAAPPPVAPGDPGAPGDPSGGGGGGDPGLEPGAGPEQPRDPTVPTSGVQERLDAMMQ